MKKRLKIIQIKLKFRMLVFEERGKPKYPENNLSEQSREPTTNSNHILYDSGSGNRTRDRLVGGERSHHCANPVPVPLLNGWAMSSGA